MSPAWLQKFKAFLTHRLASIRSSKQPEQPEQPSSGETRLKRRNEHQAVEGINRTLSSEWRQEDPVPKQQDFSQVAPNDPSNYEGSLSDFPGEEATISSQQPFPDDTESQLEIEYHRRHRNFFKPGKVFDIQSKENAGLHGHIMVVIRQNDESFLCLGVKTYNEETLEKADDRFYWSHVVVDANAYSENAKLDGGDRRKPICMDETGLPQNSWVNLEEIFTLSEKHIMVREYGTIEQGGLNDLVEYAKEVLQDNRWRDMPMWKG